MAKNNYDGFEGKVLATLDFQTREMQEIKSDVKEVRKRIDAGEGKITRNYEIGKSAHRRIDNFDKRFWGLVVLGISTLLGVVISFII